MKICNERWREELLDHAAGSPASAALAEHLKSCAACPAALREWQASMANIDAGILRLADSEPSPQAIPRIMAEVRTRLHGAWPLDWRWAMAAASAVAILIASFASWEKTQVREKETLSAAAAIASWRSPTGNLLWFGAEGISGGRFSADHLLGDHLPGEQWLKAPPRIGEYFYRLDGTVSGKERKTP